MLDYYLPPLVATACSQLLLRLIFGAVLTRQSTRIMGAFYTRHLRYSHAPKHRNQCLVRLGRSALKHQVGLAVSITRHRSKQLKVRKVRKRPDRAVAAELKVYVL